MDTFTRISVQKAHEIMGSSDVTIVDIRDANTFAQEHIPQLAQNVNHDNIEIFLKAADQAKPLICCCYHGISSQQAANFFVNNGFKEVYSIDGGFEAWKSVYG